MAILILISLFFLLFCTLAKFNGQRTNERKLLWGLCYKISWETAEAGNAAGGAAR
jgi:hypothetical protein